MTESNQWRKALLGNHCDLLAGYSFKSARFTKSLEDIPLVKGENLGHRSIDWINAPRWTASEAADLEKFRLQTGDVVLAMDRPIVQERLKFSWIREADPSALLVQRVARLRGINGLQTDFLKYLIASPSFQSHIEGITTGVNVPHISGRDILSYSFRLPSETVQQRIADILSNYDRLIDNNTRRITLLEESIHRLYKEWFVYLRFPGCDRVRVIDGVPKEWKLVKLSEIAGVNQRTISARNAPEKIQYVDISSVTTGKICEVQLVSLADAPSRAKRVVTHRDVIWSMVRPGRRAYSLVLNPSENLIASTGFAVLSAKKVPCSFLYQAVTTDSFVNHMENVATGAAYPAVKPKDFESTSLLIPDENLLSKFDEFAMSINQQINNLQIQNQKLREARDLLLPRLMNGSIAV